MLSEEVFVEPIGPVKQENTQEEPERFVPDPEPIVIQNEDDNLPAD